MRQNVSSNFSFVWPTMLNEMDNGLQNVVTASHGLDFPKTDAMLAYWDIRDEMLHTRENLYQ